MTDSVSIIVLAYNEQESVGPTLEELARWLDANDPEAQIVFVDDGSTDDTKTIAEDVLRGRHAVVVSHPRNLGMGAAIKTGVGHATERWVTFLPADGQIPPASIGVMRAAAVRASADVVLTVYSRRDDGRLRSFLSWSVRALILVVHGVLLRSDGPYLFRRELLEPAQLPPDTFFLNFEFPIRAVGAGLEVCTVPIECRQRTAGHSKSTGLGRIAGVGKDLLGLRVRRTQQWWQRALGRSDDRT